MRRWFAIFVGAFVATFLLTLFAPFSPWRFPFTTCRLAETTFKAVAMNGDLQAVNKAFGCEGIHLRTEDLGLLKIVTYGWRGEAWPYEVFKAKFYNGSLQGTEHTKIDLRLN